MAARLKSATKVKSKTSSKASATSTKSGASRMSEGLFGFRPSSGVLSGAAVQLFSAKTTIVAGSDAEVHIFGSQLNEEAKRMELEQKILAGDISDWQKNLVQQRVHEVIFLQTKRAPVWIVRPRFSSAAHTSGSGVLGSYGVMRDRVGGLWPTLRDAPGIKHLLVKFHGCTDEDVFAALLGLELASYRFTSLARGVSAKASFQISFVGVSEAQRRAAQAMGESMNMARHLVNLDANILNPKSYSDAVTRWFEGRRGVSVEVWGPERIVKEGMGLHAGVGQGAVEQSHMVHIRYRPIGKSRFKAPLAFVGKGVTFDTGGLDIKPASGMRLMKKDMGGSASVVGLANWLSASESDVACDFYLALAENAVDQNSFRPGDVLRARNGLSVEIHNTDAEGRLVMADVMDVAQTHAEKPLMLIDLATLTGAMRVAVGVEIAGFFSNSDHLADLVQACSEETGDPVWRMPLWDSYKSQLRSSFADLANASDSGFAGAITAALFLQKFVKSGMPWLHFDLYCWTDRPVGALGDIGGNGQGIQMLAALIDRLTAKDIAAL